MHEPQGEHQQQGAAGVVAQLALAIVGGGRQCVRHPDSPELSARCRIRDILRRRLLPLGEICRDRRWLTLAGGEGDLPGVAFGGWCHEGEALSSDNPTAWNRIFPFACLLCAVPVLIADYPPMVDVPQHAAQISAMRGMLDGSWPYAELFKLELFNPYWLGYGAVLALSYPLGIVWASKLIIAMSMCGLPWAAARFSAGMGVDPRWNWAYLVLPFGFAYEWGFLNFVVAAPLGFLFLCAIVDARYRVTAASVVRIVVWAHLLLFAHILIAAFFCAVAILLLADPWRGFRKWLASCLPVLAVLPVTLTWVYLTMSESSLASDPFYWRMGLERITGLLPLLVSGSTLLAGTLVGLLFLGLPFLVGAKPRTTVIAWLPFAFYAAWMLLFPDYIGGNHFSYQRFGIFGLPFYFMGFHPSQDLSRHYLKLLYGSLPLVAGVAIMGQTNSSMLFNVEARDYQLAVSHAAPQKRMLSLPLAPFGRSSRAPVYLHMSGWYQAESAGLAEFSFARFYPTPLSFQNAGMSAIDVGFDVYPQRFDWDRHQGDRYDYFLVRSRESPDDWMAQVSDCAVRPVAREGSWWLYERGAGTGCRPHSQARSLKIE